MNANLQAARRVALAGVLLSGLLAVAKITVGWIGSSTSVLADGLESAADTITSTLVFVGIVLASRPPDENHPYGHGRLETVVGLLVGLILFAGGCGISYHALQRVGDIHPPPPLYTIWPVLASIVIKGGMAATKFHFGKKAGSSALAADAWNDAVDMVSGATALVAVSLAIASPERFLAADHYGGFAVGIIVVFTGVHVIRDTTLQLIDTMPEAGMLRQVEDLALQVEGALGVEKVYARKTGLQYHVDLHLEVDPAITVERAHEIAGEVRTRLRKSLDWVADVLVHVEPYLGTASSDSQYRH